MVCEDVKKWIFTNFSVGSLPPFSFTYDEKPSELFIRDWEFSFRKHPMENLQTKYVFTYSDPETRLQVCCECILFDDFPAVEWVLKLWNCSEKDSPIIEDVWALNTLFKRREENDFILHYALGSSATKWDFAPVDRLIKHALYFAPFGGRSSNTVALPFFNIEAVGEGGVIIGIGWSGQWAVTISKKDSLTIHTRAGMELTHLKLYSGEAIRTPRILLLFWRGEDYITGHNMLRKFILAHHAPRKNGKPITLPFAYLSGDLQNWSEKASEQNQIDSISRLLEFGVEYLWTDAGWYVFDNSWWDGVGNWFPDPKRFPNGFRQVSEALKKRGIGLLVWFEPERVYRQTWLDQNHPEWIIRLPNNPSGLLNLGNEEARRWLTDYISDMIEREGISVYRHDFNMDPLQYWRSADTADRQGITEIRHIEGLYAFWDELLRRHPHLIIDNCSSGGRRIDLETISRSVFLWRTDHDTFDPIGAQSHTYGVNLYVPTTAIGNAHPNVYLFRSSIANGVVLIWNPYLDTLSKEDAKRLIEEFKCVRHFFYGDFYPLTPHSLTDDSWIAYQFHREDLKQGIVLAFRRKKCPVPAIYLKLRGLIPNADYEIHFRDSNVKQTFSGKQLAEGLNVKIDNAPGSELITYRQLQ